MLYGVGLGPGDPGLVTVRACELLQAADWLVWPAPPEGPSLAHQIASPHLKPRPGVQTYVMRFHWTDRLRREDPTYEEAERMLTPPLAAGKKVFVGCVGDALLHGSFQYLFQRFMGRFPVTIVPGVSSITAAPCLGFFPLVGHQDRLAIVPASLSDAHLARALEQNEALVILKLGRHLPRLRDLLATYETAFRTLYLERITLPGEHICPLDEAPLEAPYFSMLLCRRKEPSS